MTLSQAIFYYIFAFVLTLAFIICGCLIGAALRKQRDARIASDVDTDVMSADKSHLSDSKKIKN